MKKSQPKPKVSSMYEFQNIYSGDPKKSPGVVKAKSNKAKSDSVAVAYKKKSDAAKVKAIAVAKMTKKK
jgi:predicted ribosome-associated RNA-binding protein Tma20